MIFRSAFLLLTSALLIGCAAAPKARTVREPLWPRLTGITKWRISGQLADAATAWDTLKNPNTSRKKRAEAEVVYEKAVANILRDWGRRQLPRNWDSSTTFAGKTGGYTVQLQPAPGNPMEVSPLMLDRMRIAEEVRLPRSFPQAVEEGLGVPVVGEVLHSPELAAKYPMMPLNGGHLTLTAVLDFSPAPSDPSQPRSCRLHLYNPLRQPKISVAGRTTTLAANYTAPKQLALNDGFLRGFSFVGMFFPDKTVEDSELYRLDLYDPKRIPVVFVHGLMSDPHIWYHCINSIYADPVLRANFQPWYFLYPSGMAVPSTSRKLRLSLEDARRKLDPEFDDPGMNEMVMVGHSMGGLLNRMQTIDTGDTLWKAYFNCEPDQLRLSKSSSQRLVDSLRFKKQPFIKRLIFITVPHQGSSMADRGIVNRLASLIRLPVDSMLLTKELLSGNTDALSPQIRDWGMFAFLSVGTLSPKHPYFRALNSQPISVPHHSIIGKVGKGPLETSSDLVVPYTSSHLTTGSELVVPYWHGCVEKPEVVAEVCARLHEHLRKLGRR